MKPPTEDQDGAEMRPTSSRQRRAERRAAERATNTVARIQNTSQKRQAAWAETGQPFLTGRLTGHLEELYGELNFERKGQMPAFRGKTSGVTK